MQVKLNHRPEVPVAEHTTGQPGIRCAVSLAGVLNLGVDRETEAGLFVLARESLPATPLEVVPGSQGQRIAFGCGQTLETDK